MNTRQKKRNIILDLLRIVATLEIFLMHLTVFVPEVVGNYVFALLSKISSRGGNLVAVLFCLSGYLIFREFAEKEVDVKLHYKKRVCRIVPVYYLVLILYIAVGLLPFNGKIAGYFFFLNAVIPSDNYEIYNNMGALWTMGAFMLWYLIAPWVAKKVKDLKSSFIFLVGTFALAQAAQVILKFVYQAIEADAVDFMVGNNPINNLYFFAAGVVAYYII